MYLVIFFVSKHHPQRSTPTDTLFPYTPLSRSRTVTSPWASVPPLIALTEYRVMSAPEAVSDSIARRVASTGPLPVDSADTSLPSIDRITWAFGRSEEHTAELQSLMRIS